MAKASSDLLEMLIVDKYNIAHPESGSFIRAMSSQHRARAGRGRTTCSPTRFTSTATGPSSRRPRAASRIAGSRSAEVHELRLGQDVVLLAAPREVPAGPRGRVVDEQWFAYVCHLDPCQTCFDQGYRQPKDGCKACDDWTNPAVWPKVAPALGIVIQPKYLQDAVDAALSMPSEYALKRRLNFCIWTETHQVWITSDKWDACRRETVLERNEGARARSASTCPRSRPDVGVAAVRIDDEEGADATRHRARRPGR
jgi:hypothetical protein